MTAETASRAQGHHPDACRGTRERPLLLQVCFSSHLSPSPGREKGLFPPLGEPDLYPITLASLGTTLSGCPRSKALVGIICCSCVKAQLAPLPSPRFLVLHNPGSLLGNPQLSPGPQNSVSESVSQ